jgi:hypothetical protein
MTHTNEALKLALQSLESCSGVPHWPAICATIVTIKQALAAQQEHEPENEPHVSLASVQEPEIVQRVKRYAGQTMRTARNPNITARECIELANWIVANTTPPPAQPAVPDAMTSADIQEHIEYVAGWNECRQAMLEMMK